MTLHGVNFMQQQMKMALPILLLCSVQSETLEKLLRNMADRAQEYITTAGKVMTNAVEGFHGLTLKYRGKRIDLHSIHYCSKTNMAVCHKSLGPIWKFICLCEMGVDIPEHALSAILDEQKLWEHSREWRNQSGTRAGRYTGIIPFRRYLNAYRGMIYDYL